MSSRTANLVTVLKGGPSAENDVSLTTGKMCAAALRDEGYKVTEIEADQAVVERLIASTPDAVFNALHGRWGEDGCVQGVLEWLQIPYTHSGIAASAMAMDKQITKSLVYETASLPSPKGQIISSCDLANGHPLPLPYVLKPINEGSSVGVLIVKHDNGLPRELSNCGYQKLIAETYVEGRELTVSVLFGKPLTVTEIVSSDWYDYQAKYKPGGSRHIVPAEIPAPVFDACMEYATTAHHALGCRGLSRTDLRWDDRLGVEGVVLLETNTQPGMTPTSLAPEQAAHCGISFSKLCRQLVEDASCQR